MPTTSLAAEELPVGAMIVEGDIIVPEDFYETLALRGTYDPNLWPGGIVPYEFNANVSAARQAAMLVAMADWERVACVDFRPRLANDPNWIHIQDANVNNSWVGVQGGLQIINIASWGSEFIMAHELGHALALWHEQSRLDRDTFVQINWANINPPSAFNFNMVGTSTSWGPYDFDSVMHYGQCAFSICGNCPNDGACPNGGQTITVLPPNQAWQNGIGQRNHLSAGDMGTMLFLYPCVTGACCDDVNGVCTQAVNQNACAFNYMGDGSSCTADPCNHVPVCDANGPYSAECANNPQTTIPLDGTGSSDPDLDPLTYAWTTDCPGGSFDDPTSPTPVLSLDGGCNVSCTVGLTVTDPSGASDTCSTSVTVTDTIAPSAITCAITNVVQPIEVNGACQAVVSFSIKVDDNCCVDPADITPNIVASNPTNNATLGPVVFDLPLPAPGTSVTITGSFLVSDLTCCPATVRISADSVDCCGNAGPSCSDEADVIDNFPPAGACGLTHDHGGWNWVDVGITLTGNEPSYWGAVSGLPKGTSPFQETLDPGWLPGRPDPDSAQSGDRVMRGFIVAWATLPTGEEINWNHLKGDALLINYREGSAWEYNAVAFQAQAAAHGLPTGTPGELNLNGIEYDNVYELLLLDFYAVGSDAFSNAQRNVIVDTDLTLMAMDVDLRQDTAGAVTTKAKFDIWNMNEVKFSGTKRCLTCWDQALLSNYEAPNHFLLPYLQTDKGKARIDGMASTVCPGSSDTALLGLSMKRLYFDWGLDIAQAGSNLVGMGEQSALLQFDPGGAPPPVNPGSVGAGQLPVAIGGDLMAGKSPAGAASSLADFLRADSTTKGSLLIYPKVEIRWDWCGNLIQDTFIDLTNDYPGQVSVQMYFVNGDAPEPAMLPRCIGAP